MGVAELDPSGDDPLDLEPVGEFVEVDGLVLHRAPKALDEDVVHTPAPAVHGYGKTGVFEGGGELQLGCRRHSRFIGWRTRLWSGC